MFENLKFHLRNLLAGSFRNATYDDRLVCYVNEYENPSGEPLDRFGAVYASQEDAQQCGSVDGYLATHRLVELKPDEMIVKRPDDDEPTLEQRVTALEQTTVKQPSNNGHATLPHAPCDPPAKPDGPAFQSFPYPLDPLIQPFPTSPAHALSCPQIGSMLPDAHEDNPPANVVCVDNEGNLCKVPITTF